MRTDRVVLLAAGATVAAAATLKSVARYRVKVVKTAQLGDKVNESASALSHPRRDADHNIQATSPNNDNESPSAKMDNAAKPSWQDNVGTIASALGIAGVAIYGVLSLGYDRFYGNLAVDPADVGVTYTSTLANSAGFVAAAATVIISAYFLVYRRWYKHARQVQGGSTSGRGTGQMRSRSASGTVTVARGVLVLASLFALVGIAAIPVGAHYAGKAVRNGRPASTPYFLTLFPILEIHARPVTVQSTSKELSAIDRLPMGHKLFYLGGSNGKIVIYDSTAHQALYFPDSAVIMRVSNCYGRQPVHSICEERYRYNISWSPE